MCWGDSNRQRTNIYLGVTIRKDLSRGIQMNKANKVLGTIQRGFFDVAQDVLDDRFLCIVKKSGSRFSPWPLNHVVFSIQCEEYD